MLNRLIAEGHNPRADLFWSGDPVRPFVLIGRGLVAPSAPANADAIPATLRDVQGRWTGTAARARALTSNRERLRGQPMPRVDSDLSAWPWKGAIALTNPHYGTKNME